MERIGCLRIFQCFSQDGGGAGSDRGRFGRRQFRPAQLRQQQFDVSRDYPYGSAISLVLIVLTLLGLYVYRRRPDVRALLRQHGIAAPGETAT